MFLFFTRIFVFSLVLCTAFLNTGTAQIVGATVSGTVTDPSGAVVPNAKITIRNLATGVVAEAATNSSGLYSEPNLLPGDYEVTVAAAGLISRQRSQLKLTVGERQILNLAMQVGDAAAAIDVTGEAAAVELGNASMTQVISGTTARELPLNGRDWTQLATLEPGISAIRTQPDSNGLNNRGNRGFGGQLTIAGARPTQNNYRIDGISVNDYANSSPGSTAGLSLGAESIQEFSVISS